MIVMIYHLDSTSVFACSRPGGSGSITPIRAKNRRRENTPRVYFPIWSSFALILALSGGATPGFPQSRPSRPALIRDTGAAEGKDEAEATKEKSYNPLEAEKSIKVGDFYFKKKNYSAAIQRYLEALQYQPDLVRAHEALGRAYEKSGQASKALEVYKQFLEKHPTSPKAPDFRSRIADLEKKSG